MKKTRKFIPYRRKQDGRTNYRKRLKMLVSGIPRMVVRKTNKHIIVQVVQYAETGDHVVVTAVSSQLKKHGWKYATGNLPAAYLTGLLAGKLALSKKVKNAIIDIGLQTPAHGSRLYAAAKGAIDAGMQIPCSEEAFPKDERIKGKHIQEYAKTSKQFKNVPSDIEKVFDDVKLKISKM